MLPVSGSTSTKTGTACSKRNTLVDATNEKGVVMARSPGPMPAARTSRCSPAVPELTPMACLAAAELAESRLKAVDPGSHAEVGGAQDG